MIELQDVSKLYGFGDATTVALDEVSLRIEKGESPEEGLAREIKWYREKGHPRTLKL